MNWLLMLDSLQFSNIMDFKCIFIVSFVLVMINQQKVDMEQYVIHLNESYDNINNLQMFEFVVNTPQVVNKVKF